jgi:hypothetical protein
MAIYSWFIHKKMVILHSYVSLPGRVPTVFVVGCHCPPFHQWNGGLRSSSLNSFIFEVISFTFLGAVETQHEPEPQDIHRHHLLDVENPSTSFGGRWIPPQPTFSWTFPFHAAGIKQESHPSKSWSKEPGFSIQSFEESWKPTTLIFQP